MKKKDDRTKYQLWAIHWEDHHASEAGWRNLSDETIQTFVCMSVGFIVAEDDSKMVLATTFSPNAMAASTLTIMKRCIVKKEKLNFHMKL